MANRLRANNGLSLFRRSRLYLRCGSPLLLHVPLTLLLCSDLSGANLLQTLLFNTSLVVCHTLLRWRNQTLLHMLRTNTL